MVNRVDAERHIERHPWGYAWRERFPYAERLAGFEGGAVYTAERDGAWWLITDEGTLADLLDHESDADILAGLVHVERFESQAALNAAGAAVLAGLRGEQDIDALMARLVRLTAVELERVAAEEGLRWVNERDHLAKAFREVLSAQLPPAGYRPAQPGERTCSFPDHFPRVGDVDALVVADGNLPAWVELKCGSDKYALWACAWDAVKCALGLRLQAASSAFLVAGAPEDLWDAPILGAELFAGGTWQAAELRTTFEEAFRDYEKKGDPQPIRVPDLIATFPVSSRAPFDVGGVRWSLRCVRVQAVGTEWFDWPRLTAAG